MEHTKSTGMSRRRLLAMAGISAGAAMLAQRPVFANSGATSRVGDTTANKNTSFSTLKQIDAGLLNVGYAEAGPSTGPAVILLHGWPYDIYSFVDVTPLLAAAGYRVIVPYLRGFGTTRFLSSDTLRNGQQSVVALDIIALMDALKIEKAILAGFDWGARTADIVAALWPERCKALVSVSGYLIGSQAAGKAPLPPKAELQWWYQFYFAEDMETRLAGAPVITVPTITLEGDANGAPHPEPSAYAKKFSGKYTQRTIPGGIGHNLPQEAPEAFAKAVLDVDRY